MFELLTSNEFWVCVGTVIPAGIGYFAGKQKNKAEAKGIEVSNDKEILGTYKTELEYFSKQLDLTRKEISELRDELGKLIEVSCSRLDCKIRMR